MKHWKSPECKIGIKYPDTSWQRRLKIKRTSEGTQQEGFRTGVREERTEDVQRLVESDRLDSVEGSAIS
jgi:hypothetical protein